MTSWLDRLTNGFGRRGEQGDSQVQKIEGLALYQYDTCPFCMRVRMSMRSLGIEIELRDTRRDAKFAEEVYAATGRSTVPVLRIDEGDDVRWLPESSDIVAYLRQRFG